MLSLARPSGKEYVERAVQTDLNGDNPASPTAPMEQVSLSITTEVTELAADPPDPNSTHSRASTQLEGAYSHEHTDISFDSASSEADRSMTTTNRAYKRVQLPVNRPSTLMERHSSRVFSLPEATPKFRMQNVIGKKTPRIVSMPSTAPRHTADNLDISTHVGDPFGSDDEEHTRVRVKSQATDVPYTPSAPSSPDSVEIIANNSNQLSNDFLRPRRDSTSSPISDDEDWLTWTESPPRPIPALHGPLSLPYARCPSGAEGTIIEEPDSLPRVIWGLDGEDAKPARSSHHTGATHQVSKKPALADIPERQKGQPTGKHNAAPATQAPVLHPSRRIPQAAHKVTQAPHPRAAPQQLQPPVQPPDFVLKHSEPIDLGRLVGNTPDIAHYPSPTDHASLATRWQTPYQHQLPTPELVHDFSPELHAMLFAQERLRMQGLSPPTGSVPGDTHGTLKRSMSNGSAGSSVSLLESIKSSRSPIVLDDLTSPYGLYSQGLSAQMSALGIGNKLRQQQQLQGLLPTPPSSSSPIWSSSFSPYQDGLLSPELLAAAGLSVNPSYLASHGMLSRLDYPHHALGSGILGHHLLGNRVTTTDSLAPPIQIDNGQYNNGGAQRLPPRLAAEYARRRAVVESSANVPQLDNDLAHDISSPVRNVAQSPAVPKPPPNTPRGVASPYTRRLESRATNTLSAMPASPTSPHGSQTLGSSQQSRSVPLSKVMQRRLPIVPEEDYASSVENGRTPPAATRAYVRGTGDNASGLHLYLSPSGRPNVNAASLGLLGDALGTHYGTQGAVRAATEKMQSTAASVKLPGVPSRMVGPAGRGEAQAVKEGHGRQGSGNANKDGGQRGDSGRGRGQRRGGRGRRGRGGSVHNGNASHGTERVDGGMMVKS
ncbi:hypothetical protein C8Q77DRAFT_1200928 [Trametes polyzona]|nr:hypothetical protein C8Q77DRAFT_1200928 [Trametes polyzona]